MSPSSFLSNLLAVQTLQRLPIALIVSVIAIRMCPVIASRYLALLIQLPDIYWSFRIRWTTGRDSYRMAVIRGEKSLALISLILGRGKTVKRGDGRWRRPPET